MADLPVDEVEPLEAGVSMKIEEEDQIKEENL